MENGRERQDAIRGRVPRLGVTGRLLVLVLLPLVVLTSVSAPLALQARADAERAHAGNREVPGVTAAVGALDSVIVEQGHAESLLYALASGFPVKTVNLILGSNLLGALRASEAATDRAVAALPLSLSRRLGRQLETGRALLRSKRGASPGQVNAHYEQIEATLESNAASTLASVEQKMLLTSGGAPVSRALLALGWCLNLVQAAAAQARDNTAVFFGPLARRRQAATLLAQDDALFNEAGQQLATSGVPSVARAWAALAGSASVVQFNQFMVDGEQDRTMPFAAGKIVVTPNSISFVTLIGAFKGIPAHWSLIANIVAQASAAVAATAASLASANDSSYQLWLVLVAVGAAMALTVAMFVAQSISRPLRRLADTARLVVGGHLEVDRLVASGPTETTVVADAFNALMDNLRLLESKAQALAACDFDNEVLGVPLPGRLGASLQDSVRVLAGSIQDRHHLQERLAYEATHDTLTDLLNRAAAISSLEHALHRAQRHGDATAVLYVDLDNFKQANDLHGHQTGDHILRQVGERLAKAVRNGDIVARLGGDEFVVIAERVDGMDEAEMLAARLLSALAEPVQWDYVRLAAGASIGITIARGDDVSPLELLAQADLALYEAKQHGGQGVGVYDETLQQRLARRDQVERDLREDLGLGGGGLVLHYQPLVDTSGGLLGVEALLRWERPEEGLLAPDSFIPIAETSDLIIEVDRWVLAAAARQLAAWSTDPDLAGLNVSVNISGRHLLSQRLPPYLREVLEGTGVSPGRLTIEVTETVLLDDLTVVAEQLYEVRSLGAKVAVDDFGTGYTSLAHLHRLPVDTIKIDRSFIAEIKDPNDASLVRMITDRPPAGHDNGQRRSRDDRTAANASRPGGGPRAGFPNR
jgi:diguanylate cyclase (GGDEF)-like protein